MTAYGFTSEPASIRIVRRRDGAIMDTKSLPSAADDDLSVRGDLVSVNLYNMLGRADFRMTPGAKLVVLPAQRTR